MADGAGGVVALTVGVLLGLGYVWAEVRPIDAAIFWDAGQQAHYYGTVWTQEAGYVYPPVLAQGLGIIPWPVYLVGWMTVIFGCLWYSLRWLTLPVLAVSLGAWITTGVGGPLTSTAGLATIGNPQSVVAALMVAGLRHPVAWSGVLLTKIGPGVGVLWFASRGEWRRLAVALGATAAIALVSFAMAPGAWGDFVRFALGNYATPSPVAVVPVPLWIRLPMAVALLWWGARTSRSWTVLVAGGWAALALYEWSFMPLWLAAIPLATSGRIAEDASHRASGPTVRAASGVPMRAVGVTHDERLHDHQ